MRRILLTLLIAILSIPVVKAQGDVTGGATVVRAEYFFDTDPGYGNATIINNVTSGDNNLSLSVDGLSPGAHVMYVRSQASNGVWSATQAHPLLLIKQKPIQATRVEYFYDTDPGYGMGKSVGNLTEGDNNIVVSVEGLPYGVHHLCFRAQDDQGIWSQVATYSVFVTSPKTANAVRIEYFFDTDPGFGLGTSIGVAQDEDATYALPLDGLSMGAHMLYLRVQDNHGRWSSVQSHPIYVLNNLPDVVAVEYFFDDNDPGEGQATAVPLPSVKTDPFAFEANTAGLSAGEHHLKVRLLKNNGFWTLFDAATFTVEGLAEPEPYAVLSEDNTILTFYYDTEKQARNGMDVGPFYDYTFRPWYESRKTITTVVFDDSFANCTSLTTTAWWFYGCENLTTITGIANLKTGNVTNMREMFRDCYGLTSLDLSGFNTTNVTDMGYMFCKCSSLTSLDVSGFKTDNVTNMGKMFDNCSSLTSLDVSSFNTSKVTYMGDMFESCSSLTSLDVTNFKTDNVTDMGYMFYYCSSLTSLDLSGFNTDNVTYMGFMFVGCEGLTSLDVSNFKTDNVTYMRYMFGHCYGLTSLDLSHFNTENVTDMQYMFYSCSELTTIYAGSGWNTDALTGSDFMFDGCGKLVGGMGTVYDADHVDATYAHIDGGPSNPGYFTDKNAPVVTEPEPYAVLADNTLTFYYDTKKEERGGLSVDPFAPGANGNWSGDQSQTTIVFDDSFANCTTITHTANWFAGFQHLETIVGIENLNTENVTNMENMFSACTMLTSLDLSHFNTEKVTNMESMFWACGALTNLDVTSFNTSNVTNMEGMFYGCGSLTSLDVSSFNTSKVTDMKLMFGDCFNLTNLNLSSFNTENVTDMSEMFYRCGALTSLNVTNFNTANVTTMYNMFMGCGSLTSLDVSHFNTANVTNMESMFADCSGLKTLDLSSFNTAKVEYTQNMFRDCAELTTIFAGDEWTMAAVTWGPGMFSNCYKLVGGKGTTYDADHIDETYAHIDGGPSNPGYFTDKNATPALAEAYAVLSDNNTVLTFYYDTEKQARGGIDINNDYIDKTVPSPYGTATKAVIDASFADYRPTRTGYWFQNCSLLTTITGMENLKTDNVTDMHYMFAGCSSLTKIDVSGFKTDNVMYMIGMFSSCSSLTTLDVSNFKTDNVSYMGDMFGNCSSLVSVNLSGFKTDHVMDLVDMFDGCSSLAAIQAGNANIPAEGYSHIGNPNLLVYVNDASLAPQGVQNVVVNGVAKEIVLTDEVGIYGNNNFFVPQSFMAEKVSYTRNFTQHTQPNVSRGWESISLPFNVQNIVHESKGDLSPFGSPAEGKKFWLRRLADNGLTRASQIEANVPYVISMPNSTEYTDLYNLSGRVTFSSQYTTVPATTQQILSLADSSIVMMPTTLRVDRSSDVWAINVGEVRGQYLEGSVFERDYREVRPFEAYTVHRSNGPAPRFVPIVEMDSDATGIEDVRSLMSDGRDDNWYDLNGRKLQQKPTRKGIYILNGTKVVIK